MLGLFIDVELQCYKFPPILVPLERQVVLFSLPRSLDNYEKIVAQEFSIS